MAWRNGFLTLIATCSVLFAAATQPSAAGPGEKVDLPHVMPDSQGIQWDVQADGSIGDCGKDLYDSGGRLTLDDVFQWQSGGTQGLLDRARNEITVGPASYKGLNVSRRIAVNAKLGFCRWAEVVENPTAQKVSVRAHVNFTFGGSINLVQPLVDEKGKKQTIGMAVGDQGKCLGVMGAGRGSRVVPRIQPQQGGDQLDLYYEVEVPAKQTVVIVHVQAFRPDIAAARQAMVDIKEKDYLAQLPPELVKKVINFRVADQSIGNYEILRGDILDVVELRGGDQLKGTLKDRSYKLETFFGTVELPAERVAAVLNVGQFRSSQLVVTVDGEVFGGRLSREAVCLQLSSGQVTQVPLTQLAQAGYRRRLNEPEEWKLDRPMLMLRGGERMAIVPPTTELEVSTRYGRLRLRPEMLAAIAFEPEESAVHEIRLRDGSRFAGLVENNTFDMQLNGAATGRTIKTSASEIQRLQFSPTPAEPDEKTPVMRLAGGDLLVGTLAGTLKLETAFDTITVNCAQIRHLSRLPTGTGDAQATLWDDSVLRGQLRGTKLKFQTSSGAEMELGLGMIEEYLQPRPTPSDAMIATIKSTVAELNAEDWKRRDEAQEKLTAMGPVVLGTLQQIRAAQPAEAQRRIDVIVPILEQALGVRPPDTTAEAPMEEEDGEEENQ
jgi:hypothetical protein